MLAAGTRSTKTPVNEISAETACSQVTKGEKKIMLEPFLLLKRWLWLFALGLGLLIPFSINSRVSPASVQENQWEALNGPHVMGGSVTALALAPSAPDSLYATVDSRVFKSDDAAATWTQVFTASEWLWATAVDPVSPTIAYAGGSQALYKTEDGGLTWTQVFTLGEDVAVDPITPTNVYAVGRIGVDWQSSGIVAKSTDGGTEWTFTILENTTSLSLVVVNPITPTHLYIGGANETDKGGVICKSVDGGLSWTTVYSTYGHGIYDMVIDPQSPQTIYASATHHILKSTDDGLTWKELLGPPGDPLHLALDPELPETLYAAVGWSYTGIFLYASFDGAESWWQSSERFPSGVNDLIADPASPGTLYVGLRDFGVYKGVNLPRTQAQANDSTASKWREANTGIYTLATVNALAVNPDDPDELFAGSGAGRGGLFKSENGGQTWTTAMTDTAIVSLAINPVTTTMLWAGGPSGLYRSEDGGEQWYQGPQGLEMLTLAFDPSNPEVVFVGGRDDNAPYPNQGFVAKGKPSPWGWGWDWTIRPVTCTYQISALAAHPVTTSSILAGGEGWCSDKQDTIYRSEDSGLTWTEVMSDVGYGISNIVFAPYSPDMIYASSMLYGVHKSMDGGVAWERKWEGLNTNGTFALTADPRGWLYAGTYEGVHRSVDRAEHWLPQGTELDERVESLVIRPGDPAELLAGTRSGIWRYPLPPHFSVYLPITSRASP
jgi:photosystem II stability/assembly factor-like uncharacterized protein